MIDYSEYTVSFVVDDLPMHYYQAELLLFSLQHNANVPKENILVHCLDRVDTLFFDFLKKNQYRYKIIHPFLDGKYCNKLQQLESFENIKTKGVLLLDTDVFLLKPLRFMGDNHVFGKIVDGPNPPIEFMKKIFKEAGVEFPEIISTDFNIRGGKTFDCYFNGGLYFIPKEYVTDLSKEWRKWAQWIYERREKYSTIHVDQISMAMALSSVSIPYKQLSTNYNMPIHRAHEPHYFQKEKDIFLLHYHQEIDQFGLINHKNISQPAIVDAVDTANISITKLEKSIFYESYRRSLIASPKKPDNFEKIEQKLQNICSFFPKKTKLILHAGTPKTGTTSLQFYLDENRETVKKKGILYPRYKIPTSVPKHQWIVSCLKNKNYVLFLENLENSLKEMNENIHTIFFSTEGIFNHWMDFDQDAKYFLSLLPKYFDLKLWIWFRDPYTFAKSFYRQNLKNPQISNIACYGRDLSFNEMMEDEWFIKHFDYLGFIWEAENIFGEEKIEIFSFGKNIIDQVNQKLAITGTGEVDFLKNKNIGLHEVSEKILRLVNQYPLSPDEKEKAVQSISQLDRVLEPYLKEKKRDEEEIALFQSLLSKQLPILENKYALSWKNFKKDKKQLIIAGFHRSGTSMLAQEFYRAGLFLGENLIDANIANPEGFFEDKAFFKIHAKILSYHQTDWQYAGNEVLAVPAEYQEEMYRLSNERNKLYSEWGFKDPRSNLFLTEWYHQLTNPFTVAIYRHYSETTRSLLHRASRNVLFRPNPVTLRFWKDNDLAYRMWLAYNRMLIAHVKRNPDTCILISHDAMMNGYPVIETVKKRFDFNLDPKVESGVKKILLSNNAYAAPVPGRELKKELDDVWSQLQALGISPAQQEYNDKQDRNNAILGIEDIKLNIESILNNQAINDSIRRYENIKNIKPEIQWKLNVIAYLKKVDHDKFLDRVFLPLDNVKMKNDLINRMISHLQNIHKDL